MKKLWLIFAVLCLALLSVSCEKEREQVSGCVPEGEAVDLAIPFGFRNVGTMTVDTRTTLGAESESMVYNFYVFIFDMDNDGKKIFGHYFDYKNLSNSGASTLANWWEVENNDTNSVTGDLETWGTTTAKRIAITDWQISSTAMVNSIRLTTLAQSPSIWTSTAGTAC